jgi:hypothetical protein
VTVQSRTLISNTRQVIEEEEGQFEVKEAGNESDASSEESQPDSKSGSESGYSSDSEAELKPKKRKRNVVEDDKVDASSEEPKTDAAPEDQELTDIKIDETVVKPEGDTDTPSAPIHKEEAALPGKKFAKDLVDRCNTALN